MKRFLLAAAFLQNPTIAVIDTGLDTKNAKFQEHLWRNVGETINGIDDDNNGFIDDVYGWNFAGSNSSVEDSHGHGTHVTGIIHSLSPNSKFMILKYYDTSSSGYDHLRHTIDSFKYAIKMGAQIINYSGGGNTPSAEEKAVIEEAEKKGILVVAAAGNESNNSEKQGFYPANYQLSNIIAVTAVDPLGRILSSSNYGTSIHIAAPGYQIESDMPGTKLGKMTGTSQATAFLTGAAAQMMIQSRRKLLPNEIKEKLVITGDWNSKLKNKTSRSTQLNLDRAAKSKERNLAANSVPMLSLFSEPLYDDKYAEEVLHTYEISPK